MTDRERLIELIREMENHPEKTCPHFDDEDCFNCPYDKEERCDMQARKADYLLANGVIVPPCKVGDTVWYIEGCYYRKNNLKAKPITVTEISKKEVKGKLQWAIIANGTRYKFTSIGKTVFLTREAAEKALAERQGKNEKP